MRDIKKVLFTMSLLYRRYLQKQFSVFIICLAVCPFMGQANNGLNASLEQERVILELDSSMLEQPMLIVRHGVGQHQIAWSRQGDYVLLQITNTLSATGVLIPMEEGTARIENKLIGRFPLIAKKGLPSKMHIDITGLLLESYVKWKGGSSETVIPNRSFVEAVLNANTETIIKTKRTIAAEGNERTIDAVFSFFILPQPMQPRLYDHRMGYHMEDLYSVFSTGTKTEKGSIQRWRLEKKNKESTLSEPVKPILFYLDPAMPEKWKSYVTAGVLEWLPAFEAAGFKNAIQVKDAPAKDALNFMNSVAHSMIRWTPLEVRGRENYRGSTVRKIVDLRTGEILKADVILTTSYRNLSDEYLVRCAPLDNRARQYPLPDAILGAMIQYITAHEIGHALGLKDANFGEYAYPFDKMRDKAWLETMGHTPSIMNYTRQNYIVQPEDGIPPELLIAKVGPMDRYQIKWGYMPIDNIKEPHEELPVLEKLVREQDSIPWLRTNLITDFTGPASTNDAMDNIDPVQSTTLGLKNLQRVLELLPTVTESQSDNATLERLYKESLSLWYQEMLHLLSLVGGLTIHHKSGGQAGDVYTPISREMQLEALEYLLLNAFEVPDWLSHPEFTYRIRYSAKEDWLLEHQKRLLSQVTDAMRIKRLAHMEEDSAFKGISQEVFSTLRLGLFKELVGDEKNIVISSRRQELQLSFIGILSEALHQKKNYAYYNPGSEERLFSDYTRGVLVAELLSLKEQIKEGLKRVEEGSAKGHLKLCLWQIDMLSL